MSDLLEIENLSVSFDTPQGELEAVRDVSFSLQKGRSAGACGGIRLRKKCPVQDHYEAASGDCADPGGKYSL